MEVNNVLCEKAGPIVRFDQRYPDIKEKITVNEDLILQNLEQDFPELSREDWSNVALVFTQFDDARIGGYTFNMKPLRENRSARILLGLQQRIASTMLGKPRASIAEAENVSGGCDVVVEINTKAMFTNKDGENPYVHADGKTDLTGIAAHELKHAADQLLWNRNMSGQMKQYYKQITSFGRHLGILATGAAVSMAGTTEYLLRFINESNEAIVMGKPILLTIGGAALASLPIIASTKYKTLSDDRFGIVKIEPPYAPSEEATVAYTIATRDKWEGALEY